MQRLGNSGMKGLDHLRSLNGTLGRAGRTGAASSPRPTSDTVSYGSFANLKLTAEKLLKEQASAKTNLELMQAKLRKSEEQIHVLEAKLQEAINENARVRVKQAEDAKLWKGLDSKLSSTKMLYDQLTETLQHLACQARTAEEDKKFFEDKLSKNSKDLDDVNEQIRELSIKLEFAWKTIETGKQDMLKLVHEKEEVDKRHKEECDGAQDIIKGKDAMIKQFENIVEQNKVRLESREAELQRIQYELTLKEEICEQLQATQENLEKERNALHCSNEKLMCKIDKSDDEIKKLEALYYSLSVKLVELDQESVTISENVLNLLSLSESYIELAQKERKLAMESAKAKFDDVQRRFLQIKSDHDTLKIENEGATNKILELQKAQEFVMVQHVEECRVAEDRIRELESEAEILVAEKEESEKLAIDLEEKLKQLSEISNSTKKHVEDLQEKISKLEADNQDYQENMQLKLEEKSQEAELLQGEIARRDQQISSLQDELSNLHNTLTEKDKLNLQYKEREKLLEEQKLEIQESLSAASGKLAETKIQYDSLLEGKQLELSKHLKEISLRNDQAINDMRKRYETEKVDIVNAERERAEKLIKETEKKYKEKISQSKEEAEQYLMRVKEDNGAMISRIQQEVDQKESNLRAHHEQELLRVQLQAENEIKEKISSMRKEHEGQMQALRLEHEDECRKLQEDLELQKSKEEKQKALLQLQLKVMSEHQQNDQPVNSKEHSSSSIKMVAKHHGKENRISSEKPESVRKDVDLSELASTPVVSLMKKVHNGNMGNRVTIPKHRMVTHHEYEVDMNGRITKHKKTKSTVMFGEPKGPKRRRTRTPTANDVLKIRKVVNRATARTSAIGDLCSEGSLNPYADDPYAFD